MMLGYVLLPAFVAFLWCVYVSVKTDWGSQIGGGSYLKEIGVILLGTFVTAAMSHEITVRLLIFPPFPFARLSPPLAEIAAFCPAFCTTFGALFWVVRKASVEFKTAEKSAMWLVKEIRGDINEIRQELREAQEPDEESEKLFMQLKEIAGKVQTTLTEFENRVRNWETNFSTALIQQEDSVKQALEEQRASLTGEEVRVRGLDFQKISKTIFELQGFEVIDRQQKTHPDLQLLVNGKLVGVVAAKAWSITVKNRSVNSKELRREAGFAREHDIPLVAHIYCKETGNTWIHLFSKKEVKEGFTATTPDWLRAKEMSPELERERELDIRKARDDLRRLMRGAKAV